MTPTSCKHDYELAAAIEKWEKRYRILKEEDTEMELLDSWRTTALQLMFCGEIQKNVEYQEQEFRCYEDMRAVVMRRASNKKMEKERSTRGDPMNCGETEQVRKKQSDPWNTLATMLQGMAEEAGNEEENNPWEEHNNADHVQKGKARSKGGKQSSGNGSSWGKGQSPPILALVSWTKGMRGGQSKGQAEKGAGKRKGNQQICYEWGKSGHIVRNCLSPGTKICDRCWKP